LTGKLTEPSEGPGSQKNPLYNLKGNPDKIKNAGQLDLCAKASDKNQARVCTTTQRKPRREEKRFSQLKGKQSFKTTESDQKTAGFRHWNQSRRGGYAREAAKTKKKGTKSGG